jgi:hypothetical protein
LRPVKKEEFRKLKSIDFSSFCSDLLKLPLFTSPAGDCESVLLHYNNGLAYVLDSHASMVKRCFTVRPNNPWDNEEIHAARRKVRRMERRWELTNLIQQQHQQANHAWRAAESPRDDQAG